jgi:hypothetical protein
LLAIVYPVVVGFNPPGMGLTTNHDSGVRRVLAVAPEGG